MDAYFQFSCVHYLRMELLSYKVTVYVPHGNYAWRNYQTVFQRGHTILHFYQQRMKVLICPQTCQHVTVHLHYSQVLVGVKWYPLMVLISISLIMGFPGDSVVKNPPANAGDTGMIPGPGRSPKEGNSNPLKYSCLGNPMDRGVWWATIHGAHKKVRQNLVTKQQ